MFYDMPSLCETYSKYFMIGAEIDTRSLISHRDLLKKHFNSLTHGNYMKYEPIQPEEGKWVFDPVDQVFAFAEANGMAVRAHAPVWHHQTPDWIFLDNDKPACRELLIERMERHIQTVAGRYGHRIYAWDVVNEAIVDTKEGFLRKSKWTDLLGPDFMDFAFKFVRKYAPSTKAFYNDYNEWNPHKREKIIRLIRDFQERGIPIDGFGLQQHMSIDVDTDEIRRSIEMYAETGLTLQITELDVSLYTTHTSTNAPPITDDMLKKQYKVYCELFEIYRSYSDVIQSVTTWGVADDITWLDSFPQRGRKNYPLLFYPDHTPKPYTKEIIKAAQWVR